MCPFLSLSPLRCHTTLNLTPACLPAGRLLNRHACLLEDCCWLTPSCLGQPNAPLRHRFREGNLGPNVEKTLETMRQIEAMEAKVKEEKVIEELTQEEVTTPNSQSTTPNSQSPDCAVWLLSLT